MLLSHFYRELDKTAIIFEFLGKSFSNLERPYFPFKQICFFDFLVFALSLSLSNWVVFSSLKLANLLAAISLFAFLLTKNNTTTSPSFLGQRFKNLQQVALLTLSVQ